MCARAASSRPVGRGRTSSGSPAGSAAALSRRRTTSSRWWPWTESACRQRPAACCASRCCAAERDAAGVRSFPPMETAVRRRKHWGWGMRTSSRHTTRCGTRPRASARTSASSRSTPRSRCRCRRWSCPLRGWKRPPRSRPCARAILTTAPAHTYGKSFRDVVRAFRGDFAHPPDLVARPGRRGRRASRCSTGAPTRASRRSPTAAARSVVGGVECDVGDDYAARSSIDLARLDRVLEVDRGLARRAHPGRRARPGARGPAAPARADAAALPAVVRVLDARRLDRDPLGRALRHAPHAHRRLRRVDARRHAARRLGDPAAARARAPGRRPDRLLLGSEGILGVITEAWMRVQDAARRSGRRRRCRFADFAAGAEAVARASRRPGSIPTNCRLLDPAEAAITGAGDRRHALLVLGFESADHPVDAVDGAGARVLRATTAAERAAADRARRRTARRGRGLAERVPARRPTCATRWSRCGVISETFETAITWDRFDDVARAACASGPSRRCARSCGGRHGDAAGSRTCIPTARRPTSRCSRPAGAARSSSSGTRSRRRPPRR